MKPHPVVVVGGGVSGLATAVYLCTRGITPLVLEQKPYLGGRAYSFQDAETGEIIDNGQHVLIAGYRRTFEFLQMIGTVHFLSVQPAPSLLLHHPLRGFQDFSLPSLPPPFNLAAGILTTGLLRPADRIRMLRAGWSILRTDPRLRSQTVEQWLDATGQTSDAREAFWHPLAVSITNELPGRAAAAPFVNALRSAFLTSRHDARLAIPKVGLTRLYADRAGQFITQHGGTVTYPADVVELLFTGDHVTGLRLRNGTTVVAGSVVLTVPPYRLRALLPPYLHQKLSLDPLDAMTYSPIVSTHLWFDSDFMAQEAVGVIGRTTQWLFNRRMLGAEGPGGHISAVISAAHSVVSLSNDEIVRLTLEDLRSIYGTQVHEPRHAVVIREKRATSSISPSAELLRPSQKTAISNLFLAGDWTDTGFPATIEGAVVSAVRCAEMIAARRDLPARD